MHTAVRPGDVLAQLLASADITPTELARQLKVPPNRISQIIHGKRAITGDSALRLGHWFGNRPGFWMDLQARYDLAVADREVGPEVSALPCRRGAGRTRRQAQESTPTGRA